MMQSFILVLGMLFFPALAFPVSLISLSYSKKNWKLHIVSVSLFFAWMSYCYHPQSDTDLTRYFEYVESLADYSFVEAVTHSYGGQVTLYVFNFFGWLAMQIQDKHFLPAISTFIVYYVGLYITCSVGEAENIDIKYVRRYILFILCAIDWYDVANNLRNIMAFCFVSLAVFRDVYQKKRNVTTILCYILPVFVHPTAILIVLLRFVLMATVRLKIFLSVSVVLVYPVINFLYEVVRPRISVSFINYIIIKMYNYFYDSGSEWGMIVSRSRFYKVNRIVFISFVAAFCILAIVYYKNNYQIEKKVCKRKNGLFEYQQFAFLIGLLTVSSSQTLMAVYTRFVPVLVISGGIIFLPCAQKSLKPFSMKLCLNYIMLVAPFCLVLWMYRLHYLNICDLVATMLLNSPFTVIVKDFVTIISY